MSWQDAAVAKSQSLLLSVRVCAEAISQSRWLTGIRLCHVKAAGQGIARHVAAGMGRLSLGPIRG